MNKKKITFFLFLVLTPVILISAISCHRFSAQKKYIVATSPTFPPFETITKKNTLEGFDIDLINEIAKKGGFSIEIIPVLKNNLIYGLIDKTYDIVISGIKEDSDLLSRFSNISYTNPYFDIGEVLVISEDFYNFKRLNDLAGKKVAIQKGSKSISKLKQIRNIKLKEYTDINTAFDDLARAKVDAIVADVSIACQYVYYNDEYRGIFKIPKIILSKNRYVIILNSENQELLKKINNTIDLLKKDGTIDKMIDKWFFK